MKKNLISRILGYFLIAVIYAFTLYCATVFYKKINVYVPHWSLKLLFTDIFATIVIFIFSCIFSNASIYDPYWSVQPIAILLCYIAAHWSCVTRRATPSSIPSTMRM